MKAVLKTSVAFILAGTMVSASVAPASADYYSHRHHHGGGLAAGVAAGILGLGIIGAAAAEHERYYANGCDPGPLECHTFEKSCFHDEYGEYVCPPPARRCLHRSFATDQLRPRKT